MRHLRFALALTLLGAACGDIEVKSYRSPDVVPHQLQGEWLGSWNSDVNSTGGVLTLRIQEFASEPVVSIQINHPCVTPQDYTFRANGNEIELLANGHVLFSAQLNEDRTLVGTYDCDEDAGSWSALWNRELPEPRDLGGRWDGFLWVDGEPEQQLVMQLQQGVHSGALTLAGTVDLPGVLAHPIGVTGWVEFHDGSFQLLLTTLPGEGLVAYMTGIGETATATVTNGLLYALVGPDVPILEINWRASLTGN
jgi:hypothetical protein